MVLNFSKNFHSKFLEFRSEIGENGDIGIELFSRYMECHTNLESFKGKFIRSRFLYQDIMALLQSFGSLPHFKHLDLEVLNCQIGDTELVAFVYGLSKIPQLKSVSFKVIQNSPLSMDYIEKFIEKVSSMENLEKFDFYFRKQTFFKRDLPRIENKFKQFKDVQCSCSPQSIYLYKHKTPNSSC